MESCARGRFAPSPSGRMHLGNLFSALLAWLDIRALGGEMLLRMEDLDPQRCKPAYLAALAEDLRWLGLDWDLGYEKTAGDYCQSARGAVYQKAFAKLAQKNRVYPCFCTRRELATASAPHAGEYGAVYPGSCRALTPAEAALRARARPPAWRIAVPAEEYAFEDGRYGRYAENLARDCGDFLLRRADGVYTYQLAVAADDGAMGVTRVVRGRDLLPSTPRQIWLLEQLGYPAPAYVHVPLLCNAAGQRLAKRAGDWDMAVLRRDSSPKKVVGLLAALAGLIPPGETAEPRELIPLFSWARVGREDREIGAAQAAFLFSGRGCGVSVRVPPAKRPATFAPDGKSAPD